jgi:putative chitinase
MSEHIKKIQLENGLKPNGIVGKKEALIIGDKLSLHNKELINFLGQIEAMTNFQAKREITNFSKLKMRRDFSHLFDERQINMYVNKPIAIGNRVYANKFGNYGEESGDGYNFRANGFLKMKGRTLHQEFSNYIGEDCVSNPDLIIEKYLFENAKFIFDKYKLWGLMRRVDVDGMTQLTKEINKCFQKENNFSANLYERIATTLKYDKIL